MKSCIQGIVVFALVAGFSGCLTLGDANEVYPPTLGRELSELKVSLDRGAISPQEYEHQKAQLMAGNHPRTRELLASREGTSAPAHDARRAPQQLQRQYAAPQYPAEQAQYEQPQFDPQMQQQPTFQQQQQPQYMPQDGMQAPAMPQQQPQQPPVTQLPSEGWQ